MIGTYDIAVVMGYPNAFEPVRVRNAIVVGAVWDLNTPNRADDEPVVYPPLVPEATVLDLAAPGVHVVAPAARWEGDQPDYTSVLGIFQDFRPSPLSAAVPAPSPSAAAAHVSGALALLRQIGITDMLLAKAVLINSAEGAGYAADRGWGYLNLWKAKAPGSYFTRDLYPGEELKYFTGPVNSGALDFTFVRRPGAGFGPYFVIYDRRTGALVHNDTGAQVQKRSLPNGQYLIALHNENAANYALALSRRGFEWVDRTRFTSRCWGNTTAKQGSKYIVTCAVTNQGELENRVWGDAGVPRDWTAPAECVIEFGRVAGHTTRTQSCQLTLGAPGPKQMCVRFRTTPDYLAAPFVEPAFACYNMTVLP
jgi:hypothetical protein